MQKQAQLNARLDVLKLVDGLAKSCIDDINGCFFSNGNLSTESAIKNLKKIQGRMEALRGIISNSTEG